MVGFNEIQQRILDLKNKKNALILAHYYVPLDVQDVADHVCDSFEMAKRARDAQENLVVICGVRFMGESAKILSPNKTVLLPALDAGCPMADMITPEIVMKMRDEHPNAAVMCYVNSSAAVKAVSDVCCTSSSALRIARSIPEREIIFVPDQHLGSYVASQVPEKQFYIHTGFCPTHHKITAEDVIRAKDTHPDALFAAHPECSEEVLALADFIGSTAEILKVARETDSNELIIGTESTIVERLRREKPQKKIFSVSASFVCPNMKKVTIADLLVSLEKEQFKVELSKEELSGAKLSLDRMVNM